ncbi:MAG: DUF2156 domain-containing protein [Lachnospiraceae bacterium]|nr:DUF2156 domain-containing protein [Lachnospiraceae bacterium]
MKLKPVSPFIQKEFAEYEHLRPMYTSEAHFLNQFLWESFYTTRYATDDIALYLFVTRYEKPAAFAPLCREEDLPEAFRRIEAHFHDVEKAPVILYLADKRTVEILTEAGALKNYEITEDRDSFDYIYDAEKLRTLSGRALHKKKNLLNGFLREYEGRFQYETLSYNNIEEIEQFHEKWLDERRIYDKYNCIDAEEEGIYRLFGNCHSIQCKMGGVRIDGELKAYTIGSYAPDIKCAFVHIEKADVNFHGLYNYINQQFIINEFPEAELVNREDDLGQENLRQAKLSYRPLRLEEKFTIHEIS